MKAHQPSLKENFDHFHLPSFFPPFFFPPFFHSPLPKFLHQQAVSPPMGGGDSSHNIRIPQVFLPTVRLLQLTKMRQTVNVNYGCGGGGGEGWGILREMEKDRSALSICYSFSLLLLGFPLDLRRKMLPPPPPFPSSRLTDQYSVAATRREGREKSPSPCLASSSSVPGTAKPRGSEAR